MTTHTNTATGIDPAALDKLEVLARKTLNSTSTIAALEALADFQGATNPATILKLIALARRAEQTATGTGKCWSCKRAYTDQQRADADGHCPHCGVEIEVEQAGTGDADERALFEAWYAPRFAGGEVANMPRRANGEYARPQAEIAWQAFRAAIAKQAAAPGVCTPISVDVSTGDHDAGNRIFALLSGEYGSDGKTMLAIETSRNFPAPVVGDAGAQAAVHCAHAWNDFGQLGGRNVSWCPRCDVLAWTGKEPAPLPAAQTDDARDARDLPAAIMNLSPDECHDAFTSWDAGEREAYLLGHRDARHAAADLVLARADELSALANRVAATSAGGQVPDGFALAPAAATADEIVSRLYRRFKDWSKRGFGPDDVTWCEVKADVLAMIAETNRPTAKGTAGQDGTP